jgi:hypothetical protein
MYKPVALIPLIYLVLIGASSVLACDCATPLTAKEGLDRAKAVFSGKVIGTSESKWAFKVKRVWKGNLKSRITLYQSNPISDCSFHFKVGDEYLVYATTEKLGTGLAFVTDTCNRTKRLKEAKKDLDELGKGYLPDKD